MPQWEEGEGLREQHHSWTDEEIRQFVAEGRLAILAPPDGMHPTCLCGEEIDYISVFMSEDGEQEQVVHNCHCQLTMEEFEELARKN